MLSSYLKERQTWHLVSPKFGKPPLISLGEHDIPERLFEMARRTQDLHVRLLILPEEYDGEFKQPSCYVWEVYPPRGSSFIGRYISECNQDKNLGGLGLTIYCPKLTQAVTPANLDDYRKSGSIYIDMPSWFGDGEASYDWTKPESVLLDVIRQQPTASLETALWILESLSTAKEIHAEEESFKL